MSHSSFRYYAFGKSNQMTRISTVFHEATAPELLAAGIPEAEDDVANIPPLQFKKRMTADGGISGAIILGLIFFGQWLGKKILDETIGEKVSETIRNLLEKSRHNKSTGENEVIEYQQLIVGDASEPVIAIRVVVGINDSLGDILSAMNSAQEYAINWFKSNGRKGEIHCHTIKEGKCNLEPEIFGTLNELNDSKKNLNTKPWKT